MGKAVQFALRLRRLSSSSASKVCDTAAILPYSVTDEEEESILAVLQTSLRCGTQIQSWGKIGFYTFVKKRREGVEGGR